MAEEKDCSKNRAGLRKPGIKVLVGTFLGPVAQGTLVFACAGHLVMPRVWFFVALSLVTLFGGMVVVAAVNPELVNHRGDWKKKKDAKWWDKILVPAFGIVGFYVVTAVAALDVGRFQWSNLAVGFSVAGAVAFVAGTTLLYWAMLVNTHFETTVRIQEDRGHKVVSAGPYRIVRHPGYVGAILWIASTPLIIGSVYAMIPAIVAVLILVIRTFLEDKTLRTELNGYAEYAQKVKYRLLPGIW
ncbi:MAG: methyltransferase family protein [Planctomycetota bacterium]|jgi:protein-S-isoprenylcysteine O-methyltransferase Ste14